MKNRLILAIFAVLLTTLLVSSITVNAQTNGGDDVVSTPSSSTGSGTETSNSNGGDDVVSTPSSNPSTPVTGSGTNVSNGDDDTSTSPSTPSTPSSGSSRSSRGSSRIAASTTPTVLGTSTIACPLVTTSMKIGWRNDGAEVAKLQAFLKNVEKIDVDVTGTFDSKTEEAVKSFQKKYLETTMGPWGATKASGFVYITTGKLINKIACATPLTLTADELAIIEAYKNRPAGEIEVIGSDDTTGTTTSTTTDEIGSEDSNVAGAAGASILSKFWNFIKNLFK